MGLAISFAPLPSLELSPCRAHLKASHFESISTNTQFYPISGIECELNKKHSMGDTNNHDDVKDDDTSDTGNDDQDVDATEDEPDTSKKTDGDDADDDSGDDSDDDDAEDGDDDDGKGNSDKKGSDAADDDDSDGDDDDADDDQDDGDDPELRKPKAGAPNSEWAAWRAQEKAKKKESDDDDSGKDKGKDGEDTDDADVPDKVAAEVAKQMAPFHKQQQEQEVDTEIATFIAQNPDFKPYAKKTARWAKHPNRSGVPVKSIFYEVAGDDLMKIGAKRSKAADKKADKTKSAGGQSGNSQEKGSKSYSDMPLKDFGDELEAAKLRR